MSNGMCPSTKSINEPKRYKIPSNNYGITANEAAETLLKAEEIKQNKPLLKAALAELKSRKKSIETITNG